MAVNTRRRVRRSSTLLARRPVLLPAIVILVLFATGMRVFVAQGLTVGMIASVLLIPLWVPALARYRGGRLVVGAIVLASVSGIWLTELSRADREVNLTATTAGTLSILGTASAIGLILWARELMPDSWVAGAVGLGMLASTLTSQRGELFTGNPWKFGVGTAVTIVVLAVAHRIGKRWLEIIALLGIVGIAAANDGRSSFAILILVIILTAIQLRPDNKDRRVSTVRLTAAVIGIAAIVFSVGQTLILDGYLGNAAQERTAAQIDQSGSLILGGRPELAASFALFTDRPWGFGTGALPSLTDITVAKTGMASIGYQPNNGYVENYMFGNGFELHSLTADLWVSFGFAGLLLVAVILATTTRALTVLLAANSASALVIFLTVQSFWNLLFSPIYSSTLPLILLLGMVPIRSSRLGQDERLRTAVRGSRTIRGPARGAPRRPIGLSRP